MTSITPELLLRAYAMGVFPMAQTRDATEIHWVDPRRRGVFDLDAFHISRSLAKTIRQGRFGITIDTAFTDVVEGCADRPETWINDEIFALYADLHAMGCAHSLEVWEGDALVGGVYGVSLGAAFFGESMFSRRTDASKVALAWLIHRLRAGGFTLFDTQFLTPHLASLGAVEITRAAYQKRLIAALAQTASFSPEDYSPASSSVASSAVPSNPGTSQRKTQTS